MYCRLLYLRQELSAYIINRLLYFSSSKLFRLSHISLKLLAGNVDIPTLLSPCETTIDGNESGESLRRGQAPFRKVPPRYNRRPSAPHSRAWTSPRCTVKRVRSRVPGSSTRRRETGEENRGPLRYLLRGCVPGRYYYLYHAHNSSRSLKLFYYLFYTPPLPDSARSPSYTVFFRGSIFTMAAFLRSIKVVKKLY